MKTLTEYRRRMVDQAYNLGYSHMTGALSALPIITEIYKDFDLDNDVFILSKGHASYALYAVLEDFGFSPDWKYHEPLIDVKNGVTCTTGSLGHGLPVAAGIAYAKKLRNESGTVHVLMGDGELAEGTTWESMLFADKFLHHGRLVVHIDCNQYQAISKTIYASPLRILLNFNVSVIIHRRIKGYGIKLFQEHPEWHVHVISEIEYKEIMEELK